MDGKIALDTIALDTMKSFKTLLSPEDYTEFLKGTDSEALRAFPEVQEFCKGDMPWQEEGEKKEKKEGDEEEKGEDDETKKKEGAEDDETKEKAITPELFKGFQDEINTKFKSVTDLLQKAVGADLDERIDGLQKSVDAVVGIVEKIAGMPLGTKAIRSGAAANFFEKAFGGEVENEAGEKVLSVTLNKEPILKALETGMEKAEDPELKKSYENSIVRYNGGGGTISREVAVDLLENHKVRLTK